MLVKSTGIQIGDVIINNDMEHVIIDYKNHEDYGSCSYDREYKICLLDEIVNKDIINLDDLGYWIRLKGNSVPMIEKCDVAPFKIDKGNYAKVRKKVAKLITVYE